MISIQTNVDSMNAQDNLNINQQLQSSTIQQLTSGYRINSSADDAAGLAVANQYRNNIAELNQGVVNANDSISQLQIVDGGLSNISTILDRLKTLATESASSTFQGNRATLNQEYQSLTAEITRQASNINLNNGGSANAVLTTYIGGANTAANATVTVDLSGGNNAVDATSLGLASTNILGTGGGGVGFNNNTQSLNSPGALFLAGGTQTFTFNIAGQSSAITATVAGGANGVSAQNALGQLNNTLSQYGITASLSNSGTLQFSGSVGYTVTDGGASASAANALTNETASADKTTDNTSLYTMDAGAFGTSGALTAAETLTFTANNDTVNVSLTSGETLAQAITAINTQAGTIGINAVVNSAGTGISFQSSNNFTATSTGTGVLTGGPTVNPPTSSSSSVTANANAAITAIDNAIQQLGLVQGRVGAGENTLNYAVSLANSQISNFSTAQSDIRDANMAQDAANLTKSQVLVQTSIAALAQANSEPQAVLKLLQG
jgi:flagellin